MASTAPAPSHTHQDCSARERLWLSREPHAAATAVRHPYCTDCGTVRNIEFPRAKPLGHYLRGVAALKDYLDRTILHPKLAQVQSHQITCRLEARPEFEDPYGTPAWAQLSAYVEVVRRVRPDLDEDLIVRLLPTPRGRRSSASEEN